MLLENNLVEMVWHPSNKARYIERGYLYSFIGDKFWAKAIDVLECSSGAKIPVQCDYCGEIYYPTARNYYKAHNRDNIDCCVSCKGIKIKATVNEKYGVDNVIQVPSIRAKYEATCMKRFGTPSPLQNQNIFSKTQETLNQHYDIVNGIEELRKVPEIADKIAETNMEKYGGISPFSSKEIRMKIKQQFYHNGTCATSQKQIDLGQMLQEEYGNCELNYPCDEVSLDCMVVINNVDFDIEYDGWYWHKNREEQDKRRNYFVIKQGYKVVRFLALVDRLPTKEEMLYCINHILTTNKNFIQIELT